MVMLFCLTKTIAFEKLANNALLLGFLQSQYKAIANGVVELL
jgi:hypothetical protein